MRDRAALALLCGLSFAAALTPVADGDLFWHLAAAREMFATGGFLRADPFTISAAGRRWLDLHWLFQLFVHGVHAAGGLLAVVLAKAAVVAGGALVLGAVVTTGAPTPETRTAARWALVLGLSAALYFARHLLLARPVIFTLLFIALFLLLLEGHLAGRPPRRLAWLPLVQILWVNTQGLFAIGPALIGAYLLGALLDERARARPLALALAGVLLACLVTPYGLAGVLLPLELFARVTPGAGNVFSAHIAENVPPWVLARSDPGGFVPLAVALVLTGASFLAADRAPLGLFVARALVLVAFALLGLFANRNVLLFYWVAAPLVALNLAPALIRARLGPAPARAAVLVPLAAVVALLVRAQGQETSLREPAPFRVPAAALAHLPPAPAGRPGRIFAADHYGGYLAWRLYPRFRAFIDTRLVLHTADEYTDFLGLLDHPARFDELQRRIGFDHVLVPAAFPDRYLGLIRHLYASPGWRLRYTDGTEVLFSHAPDGPPGLALGDSAVRAAILAELAQRLPASTEAGRAARRHFARLLLVTGEVEPARTLLAELATGDHAATALLARAHFVAGDLAAAESVAQRLLAEAGERSDPLDLLALTALARGDTAAALGWLRRSLAVDPHGAEALELLARLESEAARSR